MLLLMTFLVCLSPSPVMEIPVLWGHLGTTTLEELAQDLSIFLRALELHGLSRREFRLAMR